MDVLRVYNFLHIIILICNFIVLRQDISYCCLCKIMSCESNASLNKPRCYVYNKMYSYPPIVLLSPCIKTKWTTETTHEYSIEDLQYTITWVSKSSKIYQAAWCLHRDLPSKAEFKPDHPDFIFHCTHCNALWDCTLCESNMQCKCNDYNVWYIYINQSCCLLSPLDSSVGMIPRARAHH